MSWFEATNSRYLNLDKVENFGVMPNGENFDVMAYMSGTGNSFTVVTESTEGAAIDYIETLIGL